jgi:uncharacterized membrane protein
MQQFLKAVALVAVGIIGVMAVREQLERDPEARDWNGRIYGVPYDFRVPTADRVRDRLWNPDDERIIVPHVFGIGWTVNAYQIVKQFRGG